jgi:signal transduction histidine kinase
VAVTGARFVNLAWLEPDGWIRGSIWGVSDTALLTRALTAARYVVPGFDPMSVRFRSDVNAAVQSVHVYGRSSFAPFSEFVEGTVNPHIAGLAETVLGLRWTHSVPLVVSGAVAGSLAFHWSDRPHPRSLGVAEAFSAQAALTVANVRLSEALRARAADIERSRERIATAAEGTRREIAETLDRIGSRMLVATQRILGCRELLASSPAYVATELGYVADELDRLRDDDVRAASHRLHPSLIEVGLIPALEMLSDSYAGLDVLVAVSPGVAALDDIARNALPAGVRLALYRTVEDAVDGIAAARRARRARIEVGIDGGALRTTVADEGRALATLPPQTLRTIRDRIERVDGVIEVGEDGGVARLTAVVPLPAAARRAAETAATDLFQSISENALGVTGARMVTLSWYDADAGVLELGALAPFGAANRLLEAARKSVPAFDLKRIRFRLDLNPAVRRVFVEGQPFLAPTSEHAAGVVNESLIRAGTALLGFRWTYSVPLRVEGRVGGALAFHFPDRPAEAAVAVADVFASQAELTVANERLSAALRERAAELAASRDRIAASEERVRREIAEILHGRVQSRLLVIAHRLLEASAAFAAPAAGTAATLDALARELDAIREVDLRRAITQLHPPVINVGLMAALRHLAEELGPRLDVTVTAGAGVEPLDDPARNVVPEPLRLGIYRTVEEALANVARHAGTNTAEVRVDVADGRIRTVVSDRGRGYDAATARAGIGLRSMRDRVERLGGTLSVDAAPGRGTAVTLELPLERGD